jgi:predicted dehydrogenase
MNVGIIGCGLQGWRRAKAVRENGDKIIAVADSDPTKSKTLAFEFNCFVATRWEDIVANPEVEIVIVCSPNHLHAPMSITALENGKHVLCEKPLARNQKEAQSMLDASTKTGVILKCGFNLRHHPAIVQVKEWFDQGALGELSFLRCRYGTCGRLSYEKDWRGNSNLAGGGELLDQGIHVLDLFRWFGGIFSEVTGFIATNYRAVAPLEDNAFALLRTPNGQIAALHVSWTQWRNLFSFEVFGKDGYALAEGLGGSYGPEKAILGKRSFTKPFTEEIIDFRGEDPSWREEWRELVNAIKENREPLGSGLDGLEALKLVEAIYKSNRKTEATAFHA